MKISADVCRSEEGGENAFWSLEKPRRRQDGAKGGGKNAGMCAGNSFN